MDHNLLTYFYKFNMLEDYLADFFFIGLLAGFPILKNPNTAMITSH